MKIAFAVLTLLITSFAFAAPQYDQTLTTTDAGSVTSGALRGGIQYSLICNAKAYYKVGNAAGTTVTSNDAPVEANQMTLVPLAPSDTRIAVLPFSGASVTCRLFVQSTPQQAQHPGVPPATSAVIGADGGSYFNEVPCYLRTFTEISTCTSTGPTNNGTFSTDAGACISLVPSAYTYLGQWSATLADGGPSCLNTDGGTAICTPVSAGKEIFKQLGPSETSGSCVSYSGTSITSVKRSNY